MALVPKLSSASSAVATSALRPAAGARVASMRAGPVEQASISTGTFFDTSPYEYTGGRGQARNDDSRNDRQAAPRRIHFGTLNATSEVFASLLDSIDRGDVTDDFGNIHQKNSPSVRSQAINRYELNSRVITGTHSVLGTELSLTL
ncbi:MAG: hypothetical protein HQ483_19010 [Rhodospirillales bacterium]|nr:hypothetical protein [Rhodospirillales bacterium]